MLDRLEFLLSEAFTALRRNTWMSFAAISTCCMALFLLGGMGFAYRGVSEYAATLPDRFEMRVFLKDGASKSEVSEAQAALSEVPNVREAKWIPREEAWLKMRESMPEVTKAIENPLPESFDLVLRDVDRADEVAAAVQRLPHVAPDGVRFLSEERELLSQTLALLRWTGLALGGLMLVTAGILIYNTVRMAVVARRKEIRIMQLVGATHSTVVLPLLIEGIIQGAIGGLLAALLILGAHEGLARLMASLAEFIQLGPLPIGEVFGSMVSLGALYGFVCSGFAARDLRHTEPV